MEAAAGCFLRLRVCRVEARAEVPVVKLWGCLEERGGEEAGGVVGQQPTQLAVYEENWRPQVGELCLAEVGGQWQRCKVLLKRGADCQVFLLESGAVTSVGVRRLCRSPAACFTPLPPHQLPCALNSLAPPDGQYWNCSALNYFYSLQGQEVSGQVQDLILPQGLVLLEVHAVIQQMVSLGLARALPDPVFRAMLGYGNSTHCLPFPAVNSARPRDAWPAARMDYYYPRLQSGLTEPVTVSQVSSPHCVFCQLSSMSREVHGLSESMQHFYDTQAGDPAYQKPLELGQPCATRGADGRWYRSLLQEFLPGNQQAMVTHVDWGCRAVVSLTCLRILAAEFFRMPVITFRCALYGILNGEMDWEQSLLAELRLLLQGRQMSARIEFFDSFEHLYVVTLVAADGVNFNYYFATRAQNVKKSESDTSVNPPVTQASLCPIRNGDEMATLMLAEETYVPTFPTVELKTGTFYDAMVEFIVDPSSFWIRTEEDCLKHKEMVDLITNKYSNVSKLEGIITKPKLGLICCAKSKDDTYYRAEIVSIEKKHVKVYFVDHGNSELIDWYNVKELPAECKGLPALANKCCLIDIYPLGETWSTEAILAFKVAVVDKKLVVYVISKDLETYAVEVFDQSGIEERNVGKILSSVGHVKYEELETTAVVQIEKGVGSRSAPSPPVSNPEGGQHVSILEASPEDCLHNSPYEDQLFEPGATVEVIVSHVENPGLFWCQNAALISALANMMDLIQAHCLSADKAPESNALACLAKSQADGIWYRGFITEIKGSNLRSDSVEVLYVDFGRKETVPVVNLRAMESDFFHLKSQAFKCSLYNMIAPVCNDPFCWDSKATEAFLEFAHKASKGNEFHCMFFATAFLDEELINIVDLYTPFDSICADLVNRGFATDLSQKTLSPSVQLQTFYYSMHDIKMGSEEEVLVVHVSPSMEFYCQLSRNADTLERIADVIEKACKKTQHFKLPCPGPLCLAKFTDGHWYRGFICSENSVFFVDFGNTEKVAKDDLRPIMNSELLLLPMQAIKCSLPDIPSSVPNEIGTWFERSVWERTLRALIVAREADGKLLMELYNGNEQINAMLKNLLGINVPKAFQPSSRPALKFNQRETKSLYVSRERKIGESFQGPSPQTRWVNVSNNTDRKRDQSCPRTQSTFEHQAGRDYNAKYQESRSQRKDSMPFQSNPKSELYQDRVASQDSSVRRKEMTTFQRSERHSYQEKSSDFGKPSYQKPDAFANSCASTLKHPITKISDIPPRKISPGTKLLVYLSHGNTVFDFYVQTTESGLLDQITDSLNCDQSTFEVLSEKDVHVGDVICAVYAVDKAYYRGVVKQKTSLGLNIQYMDYGNTSVISDCKIYRLPQKLCSIPAQCIHCSLISSSRAPSVSSGKEIWEVIFERGCDQQLECEFVKSEDGKWDVVLCDEQGCINDLLIPPCAKPLVEVGKGKGTAEPKTRQEDVDVIKSFTWNLPRAGEAVKVFASSVDGPDFFWCQLITTDLDSLAKEIQESGEKSIREDHFIASLEVGSPCNVIYSEDNNWYRALIMKIEADLATVRFVDYGNTESTSKNQVRQLPNTLVSLPAQAFPCCLAGFTVAAGTWTSEGKEYFIQQATEDVLELTVEDVQKDETSKIPLALVRLKYNKLDINEEMKSFWQLVQIESSEPAESPTIEHDLTEGKWTLEEVQLVTEDLDRCFPSVEDEADHAIAPEDVRCAEDVLGVEQETKKDLADHNEDSGKGYLVEDEEYYNYEIHEETASHKDVGEIEAGDGECHGDLLVSNSSSLQYEDDDYTKHEFVFGEEFETEESATYTVVIESKEPGEGILHDEALEHVQRSESPEASKVLLPNRKDILEGEQPSAYKYANEKQELVTSEGAIVQVVVTEDITESENDADTTCVSSVETVVGEDDTSEEAIMFVDSVEALDLIDAAVCEEVEAITYMDEAVFIEHEEFKSMSFVDSVEPMSVCDIGEHVEFEAIRYRDSVEAIDFGDVEVEAVTYMDCVEAVSFDGECEEVITYVDSVEAVAVGDIGEHEKVEAITHVHLVEDEVMTPLDSVETLVGDTDKSNDFEAITSVDSVEAVAVGDTFETEEVKAIAYTDGAETVVGEVELAEVEAIAYPDGAETVVGDIEFAEIEAIAYTDGVETVVGDIELAEVEAITYTGGAETVVGDSELAEVEAIAYTDGAETVDGDIELAAVEAITYTDGAETVVGDIELAEVEATTSVASVEVVAVGDAGDSEDAGADIVAPAVESLIVCSKDIVGPEDVIISDECLQRQDAATGKSIVEREDIVEGEGFLSSEETVVSSDLESEEVLLREDFIGITELVVCKVTGSSVEYGPSEDAKEHEEALGSQDVSKSLEAKHWDPVWESENDAANDDLTENTVTQCPGDEALLCSGLQIPERELTPSSDCPEEVTRCRVSEDSENDPSYTLAEQAKDVDVCLLYGDKSMVISSESVEDVHDTWRDLDSKDKQDEQPDIFTVFRDQPMVTTSPEVVCESDGQLTHSSDCPEEVTRCCVSEDSDNAPSHTLVEQDEQPDIFTVCRDQPMVTTSPEVVCGSDGSDPRANQDTSEKEDLTPSSDCPEEVTRCCVSEDSENVPPHTLAEQDEQPDIFTVFRDQPMVTTSPEVVCGSDDSDLRANQDTSKKEDKEGPELCLVNTGQPVVVTSTENKYEGDLCDTAGDVDYKGKRGLDVFSLYRDCTAAISSTESISESDVSDPSVEDNVVISPEEVEWPWSVCSAVTVHPEE